MRHVLAQLSCVIGSFVTQKKHKMSSKRYLTRIFLKEIKANGQLFTYECVLYLDESKRNSKHSI